MSLVRAKSDFKAESEEELSLVKGQLIIVLEGDQNGWSKRGWFPTGYADPVEEEAPAPQPVQPPAPTQTTAAPAADGPRDPVCSICKKVITDDSVRWNLRLYHQACLRCQKCSAPLESTSVIKKVGTDPHCNRCFDELMFGAPKAAQPKARTLPNPALAAVAKASGEPRKTQSNRVVSPRTAAVISPGRASQDSDGAALQQARAETVKLRAAQEASKSATTSLASPAPSPVITSPPQPNTAPAPADPPQRLAKLLYNQVAQTDSEITVNEGETVVVVNSENDDWWLVRAGTTEGYVPRSYLELLPPAVTPTPTLTPAPTPAAQAHSNGVAAPAKTSISKAVAPPVPPKLSASVQATPNPATPAEPKQPKTPEEHRIFVAEEILETERSYFKSLETIVKFFLQPARKESVISPADIKILFGNIDDIRTIHKTVLESLEKGAAEHKIAAGFLHMIKYLTLYTAYCKNHAAAAARYQELEKNSKVSAFMQKQKEAAGKGLDLPSLLIMPVQRVPRYRLLFAELLKYTPENHPELKELNECYTHILKIADALNEGMRIADQQEKLMQLQKSFIGSCPPLVKLGRVLAKEGTLKKVCRKGTKDRYFFLFNDLLLYGLRLPTGSYTCHAASPIENVSITDVADTSMQQHAFSILASPKSFTVLADNAEEKTAWMAAINKAIAADPRAAQKAKAPVWLPDNDAPQCVLCHSAFSLLHRRHHCLHGDTQVVLSSGVSMRIKDLVSLPKVLTLGRNDTFVAASPSAFLQQGNRMCVKLVFSDGRALTCTPDHLIRTTEGWVRADQLRSKLSCVILGPEAPLYDPTEDESPHLAAFNLTIDEITLHMTDPQGVARAHAFARFLGFLYTDGSISSLERAHCNTFTGHLYFGHHIDAERAVDDLQLLIGTRLHIMKPTEKCNYYELSLPASLLRALYEHPRLRVPCGKRVLQEYVIPDLVTDPKCPKSFVREFLGGLFGGDGYAPLPKDDSWHSVEERKESILRFCDDVTMLLKRFNIHKVTIQQEQNVTNMHLNSVIDANKVVWHYVLRLSVDDILPFQERVGFRYCAHKQQCLAVAAAFYRAQDYSRKQCQSIVAAIEKKMGYSLAPGELRRKLKMPAEQAYYEAVKELRDSEVIINEKAAIPTCDRIMRVLRKDPRGGALESLGVNLGSVAPRDFLSDMAATNFFAGPTHIVDPMGEFLPNITNPSPKVNVTTFTKEPNHASKKVRHGVSHDLDGLPTWLATFVGSRPVIGLQEVYDITVPETENFIAAGITVHNCRNCGGVVCANCSKHEFKMEFSGKNERVCDRCYERLYQDWRSGSARSRQSVYLPKTSTADGKHA